MAMNFALSKNGSRGRRAGRCSITASCAGPVSPGEDASAGIPVGAAGGEVEGVLGEVHPIVPARWPTPGTKAIWEGLNPPNFMPWQHFPATPADADSPDPSRPHQP